MRALDLFSPGEFAVKTFEVSYSTITEVNDDYFMNIINKSFEKFYNDSASPRIIAIECQNHLFAHKNAIKLSNGKIAIFTGNMLDD